MIMTRTTAAASLLALLALAAPVTAAAQPPFYSRGGEVWEGWSVGAAIGRSGNEDEHHASNDRGVDLRANLEVPLGSRVAVRAEAGRVSWRFDEYGPMHQMRDDDVTVRRVTVGLLGLTDPAAIVRGHFGAGLGFYHWKVEVGTIEKSITRGAWFTAGLTVPVKQRKWGITGEFQLHMIKAPNESVPVSVDSPVSGSAVLSLTPSIGFRLFL
jgi:hypothetical protein